MNPAIVVIAAVLVLQNGLKMPDWLKRKPPVEQLSTAQAEADKLKAALAEAQKQLAANEAERAQKTLDQTRYAQQMTAGVAPALSKEPKTPGVTLAIDLANRASYGLAQAIGDLPAEKRAEIELIVQKALSGKDAEIAEAKQALAVKDAELTITIREKQELAAERPALVAAIQTKTVEAAEKSASVAKLQADVNQWAEKQAAAQSLGAETQALFRRCLWAVAILAALYVLIHFVLPSLAQEYPANELLSKVNKTAKSITSSHL